VNLQLWDCSGDPKYHACLPALAKDCNGAHLGLLCVHTGRGAPVEARGLVEVESRE